MYFDPTGHWKLEMNSYYYWEYVAEKGDTLSGLAYILYRDSDRWKDLNFSRDPKTLQAGEKIKVATGDSYYSIDPHYSLRKEAEGSTADNATFAKSASGNKVQETDNPITKTVTSAIDKYNKFANNKILPQIPSVSAVGVGGDLLPGTGSIQIVADKTGNVGVVINGGCKGKSDIECGVSVVGTVSYNMRSVADLKGSSTYVGAGYDFGEVFGVSADYSYSFSRTSDGRQVSTHSAAIGGNISFVPGEVNTGVTKSETYTINVFDAIYNVYKACEPSINWIFGL